jgi:Rho guanine nucleotide exchange factor 7
MSITEYRQLSGNLEEMMEAHKSLASNLEEEAPPNKSAREQRIGKVLLANGTSIKSAHITYWANHPKAVSVLERHREALDAFMESQGAPTPGLMALTTGLSRPFRHLERYASVSQELEQHQEDDHIDRGDAQRSIGYYKNVAVSGKLKN